jgi:type 1 fimbria pilin
MQLFKYIIFLLALCSSINSHANCSTRETSFQPALPAVIPNSTTGGGGATVWSGDIVSRYSGCSSVFAGLTPALRQDISFSSSDSSIKDSAGRPTGLQLTFTGVPILVIGSQIPAASSTTGAVIIKAGSNTVASTVLVKTAPTGTDIGGITTKVKATISRTGIAVNSVSLAGSYVISTIPFPWVEHVTYADGLSQGFRTDNTYSGTVPVVSTNTCRVDTASQNMTVKLPTVAISSFPNVFSVGSETTGMPGRTPFVISLTGCSATSSGFTASATWFYEGADGGGALFMRDIVDVNRAKIRIRNDVGTTQQSTVTTTIFSIPPGGGTVNKTFYADYYFVGTGPSVISPGPVTTSATFTLSYN